MLFRWQENNVILCMYNFSLETASACDDGDDDAEFHSYRLTPERVSFPSDVTVLSISCGLHHSLALTSHGVRFCLVSMDSICTRVLSTFMGAIFCFYVW